MSEAVAVNSRDILILNAMDDVWRSFRELHGELGGRLAASELQSLLRRGLVTYKRRGLLDKHSSREVGAWAITELGDRMIGNTP